MGRRINAGQVECCTRRRRAAAVERNPYLQYELAHVDPFVKDIGCLRAERWAPRSSSAGLGNRRVGVEGSLDVQHDIDLVRDDDLAAVSDQSEGDAEVLAAERDPGGARRGHARVGRFGLDRRAWRSRRPCDVRRTSQRTGRRVAAATSCAAPGVIQWGLATSGMGVLPWDLGSPASARQSNASSSSPRCSWPRVSRSCPARPPTRSLARCRCMTLAVGH